MKAASRLGNCLSGSLGGAPVVGTRALPTRLIGRLDDSARTAPCTQSGIYLRWKALLFHRVVSVLIGAEEDGDRFA